MLAWTRSPQLAGGGERPIGLERPAEAIARHRPPGSWTATTPSARSSRGAARSASAIAAPSAGGTRARRAARGLVQHARRAAVPSAADHATGRVGRSPSMPASRERRLARQQRVVVVGPERDPPARGAASSRPSAVGHRPERSGSHPPPSIQPSRRRSRAVPRTRLDEALDRRGSLELDPARPRAPPRRGAGARPSARGWRPRPPRGRCVACPGPRASTSSRPGGDDPPLAIAIASTQPGPSSPASVAILPTTTRSAHRRSGGPASQAVSSRPRAPVVVGGVRTSRRRPSADRPPRRPVGGHAVRSLQRLAETPAVLATCDVHRAPRRCLDLGPRRAGLADRRDPDRTLPSHDASRDRDASSTLVVPTRSDTGPDDDDRREARHRHQHVEDAEHAAADLLGELLLELGLRRDRDERVGDAGEQRDERRRSRAAT